MQPRPHHLVATTTVPFTPADAARRLRATAADAVPAATADAITRLGPVLRATGTRSGALPVVTVTTDDADPASVHLRWSGEDDATLWPAAAAAVTVGWAGPGHARLSLTTDRARFEVTTRRLGALHRRRIAALSAAGFLDALADRLGEDTDPTPARPAAAATSAAPRPVSLGGSR